MEKLLVRDSLSGPTLEHLIDPITFFAAEFAICKVRIVNNFGNHADSSVASLELLLQRLERAVVAAMTKPSIVEHVKRHGCGRHPFFRREDKSRFGIDETPNQPGRC